MREDSNLEISLDWIEEERERERERGIVLAGTPQIQICLFNFKEESILFQMKKDILCAEWQIGFQS